MKGFGMRKKLFLLIVLSLHAQIKSSGFTKSTLNPNAKPYIPKEVQVFSAKSTAELHQAVSKQDLQTVNRILQYTGENRADINHRSIFSGTPLRSAVWQENIEIAEALLNAGASANTIDNGSRVLNLAIEKYNQAMIRLLLKKGANINFIDCSVNKTKFLDELIAKINQEKEEFFDLLPLASEIIKKPFDERDPEVSRIMGSYFQGLQGLNCFSSVVE